MRHVTRPRTLHIVGLFLLLLAALGRSLAADEAPLTNASILQMVRWHVSSREIIATIDRNETTFDLTPSTVALLKAGGVDDSILQAMWNATVMAAATAKPADAAKPTATDVTSRAPTTDKTTKPLTESKVPAHTDARFAEAKRVSATTGPIVPYDLPCPVSGGGKPPARKVEIDWDSASISPSHVDHSGSVCFEIHNFNDILYVSGFTLTEKPVTGNAIDLLTSAISTVTGLNLGTQSSTDTTKQTNKATAKQAANPNAPLTRPECPAALQNDVKAAVGAGALLKDGLSQLDPGKDSSGKINLVPLSTSQSKWQAIPGEYESFQAAISNVIRDLNQEDADVCRDDVLAAAEAVVIEAYLPVKAAFPDYASHAAGGSSHIARYTNDLDATSGYDLAVKATYQGAEVSNGTKTFSLSAGRKIASASGGFLISQIPAPSYSSVTVPTGMTTPPTQNVLGVNFGKGPQVGLVGLVNFNLPDIPWFENKTVPLNGRTYGLAISAGPTYGLTNGKSDASRIGFFGGISVHIWNQFFLTPGINVGQFSDFPQGYTKAGQVIPPNTGTPQGVNRITTRFAFGITYKIKDFGSATTKSHADSAASANPTSQGTTGGTNGSKNKKPTTE